MAFIARPAGVRISNQVLEPWFPGRVEILTQSGAREILLRGSGRWRGTCTIERPGSREAERDLRAWLTELRSGEHWTNLPLHDSGTQSRLATFDPIPASADYKPATDTEAQVGTPAIESATATGVFGNVLVLNREFPNMGRGTFAYAAGRLVQMTAYARTGEATDTDNVTVTLWPPSVAVAVNGAIDRALVVFARLRTGASLPQPTSPKWAGPFTFPWEEQV